MYLTKILAACTVCLLLFAGAQAQAQKPEMPRTTAHADLACKECHMVAKPVQPPDSKACLTCHGPMDKVVASTAKLPMNPHTSPHWGTDVPCGTCHKEHKPDRNICAYCHTQFPKADKAATSK